MSVLLHHENNACTYKFWRIVTLADTLDGLCETFLSNDHINCKTKMLTILGIYLINQWAVILRAK